MTPILFDTHATSFTTNGIGRLADCISCVVTEERNGIYECEFKYPITGKWYEYMREKGGIIACTHDDQHDIQPFDIYAYTAPIDGVVTFYAHHISYRLNRITVRPFTATSVTEAMLKLQTQTYSTNPFTFWTDKSTTGEFDLDHPENVRSLLGGQRGSVLDVYGKGDYKFDNFVVRLYANRGSDSGVTIRYGKNLSDMTVEYDKSGIYNAIRPYWRGVDGTVVIGSQMSLTGTVVDPWTDENGNTITDENGNALEFGHSDDVLPVAMDLTSEFQEQPTTIQLNNKAFNILEANQPWIPKRNITVDFVQLWQTTEYENVAALQRVSLCDRVSIYYPELGVTAENQKVIKVVYNVLNDRYDEMELGEPKTTFADSIRGEIQAEIDSMVENGDFESMMQEAIDHATDLITGGLGGHVVFTMDANGKPQEILIMDTESVDTAVKVLRINQNGIGFSSTGYNGPFTTAWTLDGNFVADFITSGTLNANLIKAGLLSDYAGKNTWNMLTGEMNLNGNVTLRSGNNIYQAAKMGSFSYKIYDITTDNIYNYTSTGFKVAYGTDPDNPSSFLGHTQLDNISRLVTDGNVYQAIHISHLNNETHYVEERIYDDFTLLGANIDSYSDKYMFRVDKSGIHYSNDFLPQLSRFVYNLSIEAGRILICSDNVYDNNSSRCIPPFIDMSTTRISMNTYNTNSTPDNPSINITDMTFILGGSVCCLIGEVSNIGGSLIPSLYFCGRSVQFSSSSSKRYKHAIESIKDKALDPHKLLKLPIRQFVYNEGEKLQYSDTEGKTLPGFIAEEVEEIYPAATIHDPETGNVESWDERRIIPGMLALIQEQAKKIEELEERIKRLEEKNENR